MLSCVLLLAACGAAPRGERGSLSQRLNGSWDARLTVAESPVVAAGTIAFVRDSSDTVAYGVHTVDVRTLGLPVSRPPDVIARSLARDAVEIVANARPASPVIMTRYVRGRFDRRQLERGARPGGQPRGALRSFSPVMRSSLLVSALMATTLDAQDITWMNGQSRQREFPLANLAKHVAFSLYVDTYFAYATQRPSDHTLVGSASVGRHGEFQLNLASVGAEWSYRRVIGRLSLQTGSMLNIVQDQDGSVTRGRNLTTENLRNIREATVGYHWDKASGLNLEAGIFMSYIGLESYLLAENWNYSRSLVCDFTPFYFQGVRLQFFPNARWKIEPWVMNGWQTYGAWNDSAVGRALDVPSADRSSWPRRKCLLRFRHARRARAQARAQRPECPRALLQRASGPRPVQGRVQPEQSRRRRVRWHLAFRARGSPASHSRIGFGSTPIASRSRCAGRWWTTPGDTLPSHPHHRDFRTPARTCD